ncbi:hypothetical protein FRC05_007073 [Tulasnella sp. 425]|nr:hypothetical protein FRC05_007073 [Tulasnella sp. 425]
MGCFASKRSTDPNDLGEYKGDPPAEAQKVEDPPRNRTISSRSKSGSGLTTDIQPKLNEEVPGKQASADHSPQNSVWSGEPDQAPPRRPRTRSKTRDVPDQRPRSEAHRRSIRDAPDQVSRRPRSQWDGHDQLARSPSSKSSKAPRGNTWHDSAVPNDLLDYTGLVITQGSPDTSHQLVNSYTGEVKALNYRGRVTVKVLRMVGNGESDTDFKKWTTAADRRLKKEIGSWKRVKGPFIEYFGFATVDGAPAVLTQFVEGTSAKEAFGDKGPVSRRRLRLFHGNIEPRHFLVDKQGKAKLGGFCFHQMIEDEWKKIDPSDEYRRSARYTPPEVLENNPTNDKSDVYSFACVAAELMTGKLPFSGIPQEVAVAQLAIDGEAHLVKDYAGLLNDLWRTSFKSCWSKKAEARPSMETLYWKLSASDYSMPVPAVGTNESGEAR